MTTDTYSTDAIINVVSYAIRKIDEIARGGSPVVAETPDVPAAVNERAVAPVATKKTPIVLTRGRASPKAHEQNGGSLKTPKELRRKIKRLEESGPVARKPAGGLAKRTAGERIIDSTKEARQAIKAKGVKRTAKKAAVKKDAAVKVRGEEKPAAWVIVQEELAKHPQGVRAGDILAAHPDYSKGSIGQAIYHLTQDNKTRKLGHGLYTAA